MPEQDRAGDGDDKPGVRDEEVPAIETRDPRAPLEQTALVFGARIHVVSAVQADLLSAWGFVLSSVRAIVT